MNNLAGMLALLTDRNGGEVTFSEADLKSIPDASFNIDVSDDGTYTLKLTYDNDAMEALKKHQEAATEIEEELATTA